MKKFLAALAIAAVAVAVSPSPAQAYTVPRTYCVFKLVPRKPLPGFPISYHPAKVCYPLPVPRKPLPF